VSLKDVIDANKGLQNAAATTGTSLTATATATAATGTIEDKDTKASRPLATKFGDKPSFSGDEDAHESWTKMITAR